VHRDLKPANIKVRPDGLVKVLDFGLAKAVAGDSVVVASHALAHSPTITSPIMPLERSAHPEHDRALTVHGVILGTAAYMSPEQARGKPVDRRADIWAFGCVLFEMLTGRRTFAGDDVSDTLASVLRDEPAWDALPETTPAQVRRLIRRCLQRDVQKRLPHLGVARLELGEDELRESQAAPVSAQRQPAWRTHVGWAAAAATLAVGVAALVRQASSPPPAADPIRFQIAPPAGHLFPGANGVPRFSLSPDGSQVVFAAALPGQRDQLFLRRLDEVDAQPIKGTESPPADGDAILMPFVSSDGRYVAFFSGAESALKRAPVNGGPPERLATLPTQNSMGAWHGDVILASSSGTKGVLRVPAGGGEPGRVTSLDEAQGEVAHLYPQFLPNGRQFLFTARRNDGSMTAQIASLDGGAPVVVVATDGMAQFAEPDQMLFVRDGSLVRQPIDLRTLEPRGEPTLVTENVMVAVNGRVGVSSSHGVLAFAGGSAAEGAYEVLLRDRSGREIEPGVVEGPVMAPWVRLSPDGRRLAFLAGGAFGWDIWMRDVTRGIRGRLTASNDEAEQSPVWSPDGQRVAYRGTNPDGTHRLVERDAAGLTPERLLVQFSQASQSFVQDWSPDGRYLVVRQTEDDGESSDIVLVPTAENSKPRPFLRDGFTNLQAAVSPDGRWLAYASDEGSTTQVFVRSFPDASRAKVQVSAEGGGFPRWRRDGRELYYADARGRLTAVPVDVETGAVGKPTVLFTLSQIAAAGVPRNGSVYDVSADGQRFYVVVPRSSLNTAHITVAVNWLAAPAR
jgi:Tol biopolymer transport system component